MADKNVETLGDSNIDKKFPSSKITVLLWVSRSSDQRVALVEHLTKRLSLRSDTDDIVLNFAVTNREGQSDSVQKEAEGMMSKS